MDVLYLDFAKAYDKVDIPTLSGKIRCLGILDNIGSWIGSFMANRTQRVKIRDTLSKEVNVRSGVPQGSVLGPILFLIFIADMGKNSSVKSFLYVDDSKVMMPVSSEDDVRRFQEELEIF